MKLKGFTLIELLVVIGIIGILMSVATISYVNAQQKSRDNKRKSDLKAIQQSLETYFQQNAKYPYQGSTAGRISCTLGGTGIAWDGSTFTCNSIAYMSQMPRDPVTNTTTQYFYYSDNSATPPNMTYKLFAKIENIKDQDLIGAPTSCSTNNPGAAWATNSLYYCVINH